VKGKRFFFVSGGGWADGRPGQKSKACPPPVPSPQTKKTQPLQKRLNTHARFALTTTLTQTHSKHVEEEETKKYEKMD
jgi:hypothetical protein